MALSEGAECRFLALLSRACLKEWALVARDFACYFDAPRDIAPGRGVLFNSRAWGRGSTMVQLIGLIAGTVSIGASIYFLFVPFGECRSAEASVKWPSAPGQIIKILVQKFGLWRPAFLPVVEYPFHANGRDQTGKRIAYRVLASRDEKEAQAFVKKYPVGAKVKVTYDPANPQDSVLEPGPEGTKVLTYDVIWFFCVGVFCVLTNLLL
jgi:hypothetical protein